MAKSRVEKNKKLYDEIELESFDINKKDNDMQEEVVEVLPVKEETNETQIVEVKEEFVVEQPISYTNKLSVEEILRAKLEKQRKLKQSNKTYKKSPITDTYTSSMMQKNIKQHEGIDVRKEMNIEIKKEMSYRGLIIGVLAVILVLVIVYFIVF